MVAALAGDDIRRHARAVPVSLDQPRLPRRLRHAAVRMALAHVFRIQRDPHLELRPLELQRLHQVVTDPLALAVLGTVLHLVGNRGLDLVPRQVLGQLLAPRLARHVLATLVRGHDDLRLLDRLGQARRRGG